MKKLLSSFALLISFLGFSQVFQEDFDGNGPGIGAWTVIDVDGLTPNTNVSFISNGWNAIDRAGANGNFGGPAGNYAAMSTSWYTPSGTSNDWLITPSISLPAQATYLKWDAKAQDADFPDGYKVMLSPNGGNTVSDFTVELFSVGGENPSWTTRTVSLASYIGTNIRIAFVNNSNDMFVLLVDNVSVLVSPTSAPDCPTLASPANASTGISYSSAVALSWTAPSSGSTVESYDVFFGTSPNPTTLLTNVTTTTASVPTTSLAASTTYYWRVEAKNSAGNSTGCSEWSFTTMANPIAPYCGPLIFTTDVEPITLVNFAGINNTTDATVDGTPAHEVFLDQTAQVAQGSTYTITLKGNTGGNYTNRFMVFADWNQDGDFADSGEAYTIAQTIVNSTGTDAIQATQDLLVPADATPGTTRLRVKKILGTINYNSPCLGTSFGQAEEYTVNVSTLAAVSEVGKVQVKAYPNPVVDVLNLESPGKIKSVNIFDLSGKKVANFELNETKSQLDLSKLSLGIYVVKAETQNGSSNIKIIKK